MAEPGISGLAWLLLAETRDSSHTLVSRLAVSRCSVRK